jgi:IrrE N-terminal-like domain
MKMVRDATGRFNQRPHYESSELDRECEKIVVAFLKQRYGEVKYPISTDDLTGLIEAEADDLDHYADLSEYGSGVEGVTVFQPGGKPIVKIAATLSDDNRENRRRTTLTHEYGHVRFHSYLFDTALGSMDLFASDKPVTDRVQVCKRDTMLDARSSDWMEWQAGHVCGAILMPAGALREVIKEKFAQQIATGQAIAGPLASTMIEEVQGRFQVSQEAARVRLLRLQVIRDVVSTQALF